MLKESAGNVKVSGVFCIFAKKKNMDFGLLAIIGAHTQLEIDEGRIDVDKCGFVKKKKRLLKLRKNNKKKVESNDAR